MNHSDPDKMCRVTDWNYFSLHLLVVDKTNHQSGAAYVSMLQRGYKLTCTKIGSFYLRDKFTSEDSAGVYSDSIKISKCPEIKNQILFIIYHLYKQIYL